MDKPFIDSAVEWCRAHDTSTRVILWLWMWATFLGLVGFLRGGHKGKD